MQKFPGSEDPSHPAHSEYLALKKVFLEKYPALSPEEGLGVVALARRRIFSATLRNPSSRGAWPESLRIVGGTFRSLERPDGDAIDAFLGFFIHYLSSCPEPDQESVLAYFKLILPFVAGLERKDEFYGLVLENLSSARRRRLRLILEEALGEGALPPQASASAV